MVFIQLLMIIIQPIHFIFSFLQHLKISPRHLVLLYKLDILISPVEAFLLILTVHQAEVPVVVHSVGLLSTLNQNMS